MFSYKSKADIIEYIHSFDVTRYAKTRNFVDGGVSYLSPYITHGIITHREVISHVLHQTDMAVAKKFIMELIWKEFFLQVQKNYGNDFLYNPIREDKTGLERQEILPQSLIEGDTGTEWVNTCVYELENKGYLHNHKRMWLASWCQHVAQVDRKKLAKWTYFHFVDGELASNHLSRQRVASTFGNKPYIMNEKNIEKYRSGKSDPNLRYDYEQLVKKLFHSTRNKLFENDDDQIEKIKTPVQQMQNIDHREEKQGNVIRILSPRKLDEALLIDEVPTIVVLDDSFTKERPRSQKRIDFVKNYCKRNGVDFMLASYDEIISMYIQKKKKVIIDERYDPSYTEVQSKYKDHPQVSLIPYPRVNTDNSSQSILKFFKYRKRTKPFIQEIAKNAK